MCSRLDLHLRSAVESRWLLSCWHVIAHVGARLCAPSRGLPMTLTKFPGGGGGLVLRAVRTVFAVEIAIVRWRSRVFKRRLDRRARGAPLLRLLTQVPARTVRAIA